MSAAKNSKNKSCPLVPRMMIDGFERDVQESYIRERAPEILETLLIDRTMTAADAEGRVHRIRWCTDDYGFVADAEIDPELISKPDVKIIRPRVDKRSTFDEHGRKVGPKTSEVGQKFANVEAKGTEAGQKTAEVGQKTLEVGAKGKKLGANPAEVGANGEELRANFDSVMANYRKDFRETCFKVWQLLREDSSLTQRDIYPRLRLAYSSVQSAYNALQEVGLLRREGRGKGSNWIVVPKPSQPITKPFEPITNARKPITKRRASAKKGKVAK